MLVGQGGKDLVRTDFYLLPNGPGDDIATEDHYLFGDFGYGAVGDSYNPLMQYGKTSEPRMNKFKGDDDILHGGRGNFEVFDSTGDRNFDEEVPDLQKKKQYLFAGDGEDKLSLGDEWYGVYGFGHDGNDVISLPVGSRRVKFYGGDGNDKVKPTPMDHMRGLANVDEYGYGGDGNDWIQGSHKLLGIWVAFGGNGDDKLVGGDLVRDRIEVHGEDGNDILKGGNGSTTIPG